MGQAARAFKNQADQGGTACCASGSDDRAVVAPAAMMETEGFVEIEDKAAKAAEEEEVDDEDWSDLERFQAFARSQHPLRRLVEPSLSRANLTFFFRGACWTGEAQRHPSE